MTDNDQSEPDPDQGVAGDMDHDAVPATASSTQDPRSEKTGSGDDDKSETERAIDWMWYFTFVIAFAAVIQGVATSGQWIATREALRLTRESNEQTRISNEADLRPWVLVSRVPALPPVPDQPMTLKVSLANFGRTPASSVKPSCTLKHRAATDPQDDSPVGSNDIVESFAFLAPGQSPELTIRYPGFNSSGLALLESGEKVLNLFCTISYDDILAEDPRNHSTRFCGRWDPRDGLFKICETGNDAN